MLTPSDSSIIGAIAHGHIAEIDKAQFSPDWLDTDTARGIVRASLDVYHLGKAVNLLNVVSAAARFLPKDSFPPVVEIWNNGYGDVNCHDAVSAAKLNYMVRQAKVANEQERILLETKPHDIERWLPTGVTSRVSLLRTGEPYDARPSSHWEKRIPQVVFKSLIPKMNEVLRGGYRDGAFYVYAGVTKHGKTTTLISHAIDALEQDKRVVFINTENAEQKALVRILWGLSGLLESEIVTKKGSTPERDKILHEWLEYLEDRLLIYNWAYLNDQKLKQIVSWNHPDLLVIDYLKEMPGMFADTRFRKDQVGDMADFLLRFANENCLPVITAGQISGDAAKRVVKNDTAEPEILYGTAKVGYAADVYSLLKRHPSKKNTAYFRTWLDRLENKMDTVTEIPLNPERWILLFPHHIKNVDG